MSGPVGFLLIRTGHAKPEIRQHFSDARHAYAADADEMNRLEASEHSSLERGHRCPRERAKRAQSPPSPPHPSPAARLGTPGSGHCPARYVERFCINPSIKSTVAAAASRRANL